MSIQVVNLLDGERVCLDCWFWLREQVPDFFHGGYNMLATEDMWHCEWCAEDYP